MEKFFVLDPNDNVVSGFKGTFLFPTKNHLVFRIGKTNLRVAKKDFYISGYEYTSDIITLTPGQHIDADRAKLEDKFIWASEPDEYWDPLLSIWCPAGEDD